MIQAMREMREQRLPGPQPVHDREGLLDREMGGVRLDPQRVEDQGVQPLQQRPALVGYPVDIRAIGEVSDPESQHGEGTVLEADRQERLAEHLERDARPRPDELDLGDEPRRPALGLLMEGVGEDPLDAVLGLLLAEDGDGPADPLRETAGRRRARTGGRRGDA